MHQGRSLSQWIRRLDTRELPEHNVAVDAIVAIGSEALPALAELLDHADPDLRTGAATAMLRIDRDFGLAKICPLLEEGVDPRWQLSSAGGLIRANVEPERAVLVLARNVLDPEYTIHFHSCRLLGEFTPASTSAVPALVERLRNETSPDVRWRMTMALVRIGPGLTTQAEAADTVSALRDALADDDARVREEAAHALEAIGPAAKPAAAALRVALNDKEAKVRFRAKKALERQ